MPLNSYFSRFKLTDQLVLLQFAIHVFNPRGISFYGVLILPCKQKGMLLVFPPSVLAKHGEIRVYAAHIQIGLCLTENTYCIDVKGICMCIFFHQ